MAELNVEGGDDRVKDQGVKDRAGRTALGKALLLNNVFLSAIGLEVVAVYGFGEEERIKRVKVWEVETNNLQSFFSRDFVEHVANI